MVLARKTMKKKSYKYPLCVVFWDDAVEHSDNLTSQPYHQPARQVTAGWLLKNDKEGISLAFEYAENEQGVRGEAFIPSGMVTRLELIDLD